MSVTSDILRSWHSPRLVMRARLSQGVREDRALAVLFCACLMMFIAQWPGLARAAQGAPDVPLQARLGGALLATMFLLPLVLKLIQADQWGTIKLVLVIAQAHMLVQKQAQVQVMK